MQQTTAPLVSGGAPVIGHTLEFLREPVALLQRGSREHGEVFGLRLGGQTAVVLLGADNHRFFFAETDGRRPPSSTTSCARCTTCDSPPPPTAASWES
jgi:hypothetical protein